MRTILVASLLLTACSSAELSTGGEMVVVADVEPLGCRPVGTVREAEGGALRSFVTNREMVAARLRNEAARLGGNSVVVIQEERGDTDSGAEHFTTGVPGLAAPNPRCTNCVMMTARVYSCAGQAPRAAVVDEPGEPAPAPPPAMAPPPTVIIVLPPPEPPPER